MAAVSAMSFFILSTLAFAASNSHWLPAMVFLLLKKLNMSALTMLIYIAYIVLRASIQDIDKKRRISSAYNIFALVAVIPLIFVLPRLTDSLHPGNGGNPAFGSDDMDNVLRMVFYPSVIAFTLIGLWIASLKYRLDYCSLKIEDIDE